MNKYQEALDEIKLVAINIREIPKHYCDVICSKVSILQELVDRATAQEAQPTEEFLTRPDLFGINDIDAICPVCGEVVCKFNSLEQQFCSCCGQNIDWGNWK